MEASASQQGRSWNRRSWDRRDGGASAVGVARDSRTTVARDVPATAGAPGDDPETGGRRARAWHPDGGGSTDTAGTVTGAATFTLSHLQRAQLRVPSGPQCAY